MSETEYAKPPRAPRAWDAEARQLFASWRNDPLAAFMTELDWIALVRVINTDMTRRQKGELRADLLRVIDSELSRIRKVAVERMQAAEEEPDDSMRLPPEITESEWTLAVAAYVYADLFDQWVKARRPDLWESKHRPITAALAKGQGTEEQD